MYLDFRALVTQRIYMLIQGYVDTNGAYLLKYDPLFSVSKKTTVFGFCHDVNQVGREIFSLLNLVFLNISLHRTSTGTQ